MRSVQVQYLVSSTKDEKMTIQNNNVIKIGVYLVVNNTEEKKIKFYTNVLKKKNPVRYIPKN